MRSMRYWSGKGVNVLVMDGSDAPLDEAFVKDLELNICYHYFPISIHDRIERSLELFETEYALLYGDDEFFSIEGLEICIKELEKDTELVSCMGRCIGFDPSSGALMARPWYLDLKGYKILEEDPIERMVNHMGNYGCSTIYGVTKTSVWKYAMKVFVSQRFSVFSIEEYMFEMVVAFMGKSKVIPVLYWFRSLENSRIIQGDNRFNIWWHRDSSNDEKILYINYMTESLSVISSINKRTLKKGVIRTGDAFTKWGNLLGIGGFTQNPNFLKRGISFFTRKIRGVKRRILRKKMPSLALPEKKKMYPFLEAVDQLKKEGVTVNEIEITEIESIVMDFHRNCQDR
jgi:glycosyltransferase domain-containing protein